MERMIFACGRVPTLNCTMKRWWPKTSCWKRIFSITCCALPTKFAPRSSVDASNWARVIGGQPRSRPILSMTTLCATNASSAAACDVSAMNPCELMLSAGVAWPYSAAARRCSSANGAKRSGWPPMIASAIGSPSAPARTTDCRVPPTATQTGSGAWAGRGETPWPSRGRRRADARAGERRTVAARPVDVLGLAQREQQLELLGEELVVVLQVVAEQREALDERAAPGHDLGPAAGEQVERREVLEDADGVVGAEDADGARQPDALGPRGRSRQHDRGRGDRELGAMMLADAEDVEAELVGELDLLEQVREALLRRDRSARARVGSRLREGVDAEFHQA